MTYTECVHIFNVYVSVFLSTGTNHDHDQPPHLVLKDLGVPEYLNGPYYAAPESRYCPAGKQGQLGAIKYLTFEVALH